MIPKSRIDDPDHARVCGKTRALADGLVNPIA
jgi:hypothetical protein